MAGVEFQVSDEIARQVKGFFEAGCPGSIIFTVKSRRVLTVEVRRTWDNDAQMASRRFLPTASGVFVVEASL